MVQERVCSVFQYASATEWDRNKSVNIKPLNLRVNLGDHQVRSKEQDLKDYLNNFDTEIGITIQAFSNATDEELAITDGNIQNKAPNCPVLNVVSRFIHALACQIYPAVHRLTEAELNEARKMLADTVGIQIQD